LCFSEPTSARCKTVSPCSSASPANRKVREESQHPEWRKVPPPLGCVGLKRITSENGESLACARTSLVPICPYNVMKDFYQALLARDYRFDGKFFVAVKTTGVYCRPICPARPKRENVVFFPDAASAEAAGYRPCLRCRPECAPLSSAWWGKRGVGR